MKLCECGCGNPAPIAKMTKNKAGHIKGKPVRFINGHNGKIQPMGKEAYRWNGGIAEHSEGYILIYKPNHKRVDSRGYVRRPILIAEKALGKELPPKSVVHHVNEIKNDDVSTNLVLCEDDNYHKLLHRRTRAYKNCGHANWQKCWICKRYDDPKNLYIPPKECSAYHYKCREQYKLKRQNQQTSRR